MKRLLWSFCILLIPAKLLAAPSIQFDLTIKNSLYDLVVQEVLPASTTFSEVTSKLRNPELFKAFDPSITGMSRNNQTGADYLLTQEVTQYRIKNYSVFKCHEDWAIGSWTRHCDLQTSVLDSGKYMYWKFEDTNCSSNADTQETSCKLHLVGEMKDIKLARLTLMSAPSFAAKAKYEAIKHFAKIWMYTIGEGASIDQTIESYETGALSALIEKNFAVAKAQASSQGTNFNYKAHIQYP